MMWNRWCSLWSWLLACLHGKNAVYLWSLRPYWKNQEFTGVNFHHYWNTFQDNARSCVCSFGFSRNDLFIHVTTQYLSWKYGKSIIRSKWYTKNAWIGPYCLVNSKFITLRNYFYIVRTWKRSEICCNDLLRAYRRLIVGC